MKSQRSNSNVVHSVLEFFLILFKPYIIVSTVVLKIMTGTVNSNDFCRTFDVGVSIAIVASFFMLIIK